MNKIATFMIGFVLGGAVGGAIYLSGTQDDSTSGPIEQPSVSGSSPAEDSPTPASSGTDDPDASPTPTVAVATRVTEADELRIDGLGSMTMHVNDVERATGMDVDISSDFSLSVDTGSWSAAPVTSS